MRRGYSVGSDPVGDSTALQRSPRGLGSYGAMSSPGQRRQWRRVRRLMGVSSLTPGRRGQAFSAISPLCNGRPIVNQRAYQRGPPRDWFELVTGRSSASFPAFSQPGAQFLGLLVRAELATPFQRLDDLLPGSIALPRAR